jgi:predicted nucleic-acid-binding protein
MIAVDTNVVVRLLVADDPLQGQIATRLFEENEVAIPHTVLLETEWVLRKTYRFTRARIAETLLGLLGIRNVVCARRDDVANAIGAMAVGCEFADALHAATADRRAMAFATFDKDFAKHSRSINGFPRIELVGEHNLP